MTDKWTLQLYTLTANREPIDADAIPDLLRHVADQLDKGYVTGYYPTWTLDHTEATS